MLILNRSTFPFEKHQNKARPYSDVEFSIKKIRDISVWKIQ